MAAAIVRGGEVLASVVHSQHEVHRPYGGVVPELASRDHVRQVSGVVARVFDEAGVGPGALDGVAVTSGPGLIGSLLVGLSFGKAFAYRHRLPFVGVHHLVGHLVSAELADASLQPPYLGLVVSGGHTALYRIEQAHPPRLLGETRDDAVGEAFDKVAKLLGLSYPGGPAVSAAARSGNPSAIAFPRPMSKSPGYDFSYSGLKTAVALEVERRMESSASSARSALSEQDVADIAASFEAAATDVLVARTRRAVADEGLADVAVVGGVAANQRLRASMAKAGQREGFRAVFPPLSLCTDNAAMIAAAGLRLLRSGEVASLDLNAFSRAPLAGVAAWDAVAPR